MVSDVLSAESEIQIVGTSENDSSSSLVAARAEGASAIIASQLRSIDEALAALLDPQPLTVVALNPDGTACVVVTLDRREIPLEGKNLVDLMKAMPDGCVPGAM